MDDNSLFVVVEGLDGSGKTSIARQLVYFLQTALKQSVKLTFEPHDPSGGGLYIRQVLEKKITHFSHETLMLAFAANRLDHCSREINPWLSGGEERIVICDRYYLSSLVYQSNDDFSFADVMSVSRNARKPDLTIFMNVSNEVCYERMKIRNKPQELFETDLSNTRQKYLSAIEFLRTTRDENIVVVDAGGTMQEVLEAVVTVVAGAGPAHWKAPLASIADYQIQAPDIFNLTATPSTMSVTITDELLQAYPNKTFAQQTEEVLSNWLRSKFETLSLSEKGTLLVAHLQSLNYTIKEAIPWTPLTAYSLEYTLPGGIIQLGAVLFVSESQRYDLILESVAELRTTTDFMFVFSPGAAATVTNYYEREIVQYKDKVQSLFPATRLITELDLQKALLENARTKNLKELT
ncbi:MAG: dTMP kinase [Saprospiraceae bacterium]